jgi:hypothetical protein
MSAPLRLIAAVLGSEDQARRILEALDTAGYVCVPREPTPAMIEAAYWPSHDENAAEVWQEMLKAATNGNADSDRE